MRAVEAIEADHEPHPCKLGRHLVSPATKERGYGFCAECGSGVGHWPKDERALEGKRA